MNKNFTCPSARHIEDQVAICGFPSKILNDIEP